MQVFKDFRSDTVTKPTKEMLECIWKYDYDDDVFEDDQTIKLLENKIAALLNKEDALFVPTGTFSNQLALFTHCKRGEEVIVDQESHIKLLESGACAVIAGVQLFTMESNNGYFNLEKLEKAICQGNLFSPKTTLVCLENAYGGKVLSLDYINKVAKICHDKNIKVHLDGARLFNATTFLKLSPKVLCENIDSISVCLSKGLGAPIGSLLIGSKKFIEEARYKRKVLGGGMRQVGILGAMGIYALDNMIERLKDDHDNASYLADELNKLSYVKVDMTKRDINMVFCQIQKNKEDLDKFLYQRGIKILPQTNNSFRFVTHYGVNRTDIDLLIESIKEFYE